MSQLFTNNAASTLAAGITNVATSLSVVTGAGAKFPSPTGSDYFLATLFQFSGGTEVNWEIVKVTARATDTFTIVRAQEGTTARAFNAGDPIELRVTAAFASPLGLISSAAVADTSGNVFIGATHATGLWDGSSGAGLWVNRGASASQLVLSSTAAGQIGSLYFNRDSSGAGSDFWWSFNMDVSNTLTLTRAKQTAGNYLVGMAWTQDGRVYGAALHNNAGAVTGTTNQYIASGTYTPTLTNNGNCSVLTARQCQWKRVGNVVSVSGAATVTVTAAATLSQFFITLPIASTFTTLYSVAGTGVRWSTTANEAVAIFGETANHRAEATWLPSVTTANELYFTFQYEVL